MRAALPLSLAVLGAVGTAVLASGAEPPKPGRALRVQGNQFVDATGKPVVFRGVAVSDPDKLERGGHWNKGLFEEIRAWGANIVRLPVHPVAWRARGPQAYLALLDQGVAWVLREFHTRRRIARRVWQSLGYLDPLVALSGVLPINLGWRHKLTADGNLPLGAGFVATVDSTRR